MKLMGLLILGTLAFTTVSCGNKNESGGAQNASANPFSTDPYTVRTVNGLINVDTLMIQFGDGRNCSPQIPCTYQASQQTKPVVMNALDNSFKQGIQPDGARMLKATITGAVSNMGGSNPPSQTQYPNQYPSQYPTSQYGTFDVQRMVIYR